MLHKFLVVAVGVVSALVLGFSAVQAQDVLPHDNGLATYHTSPRYRESESHPLRIVAYVAHPIGWLAREVIFRPLSYFASSTETTRSIMGYREPYDYRQPECFASDESVPDCRSITPFNYDSAPAAPAQANDAGSLSGGSADRQVYFPNVNFDFDKRTLNELGKGRVRQIGDLLKQSGGVQVVLQGHADSVGSEAYNEKLGMDRAEAVRQELVSQGISSERLSTVSFGETQPLYSDEADWARALNRRVEVHPNDGAAAPLQ